MGKTLFDKIWEQHAVREIVEGNIILYIDRHYIHEVTSAQAFGTLEQKQIGVFRPDRTIATADHNVPTVNQHLPIAEPLSRKQVKMLGDNCRRYGITHYGLGHSNQGIVHVMGPELGHTLPGMTIVCGDSHTSTHGAFGCIAFGIGTTEVGMVLATQCLLQHKPKSMRIHVDGGLQAGVTAKDVILYIISKMSSKGAAGYFVEYAGTTINAMTMEERMTLCNMSIEMGARGGLIAPDDVCFNYVKDREFAPKDEAWEASVAEWKGLFSDTDAAFDQEVHFIAEEMGPMITYGTDPGSGMRIDQCVPYPTNELGTEVSLKGLDYMGLKPANSLLGKKVDYVFIGSCTNGRIEDLRAAASLIKGRQKAANVEVWIVPGSRRVEEQMGLEGLDLIFKDAGIQVRQPGCSACLAMNEDKIPAEKYCVSTSNRNFEGRQGPGARTFLVGPLTAAAAAITGFITDPREFL